MAPKNSSGGANPSPSSRKKSTSTLTQSANASASALPPPPPPSLFAFNADSQSSKSLFAAVSTSHVGSSGKERLRVWDVATSVVIAEWDLGPQVMGEGQEAVGPSSSYAVRSLTWATLETESLSNSSKRANAQASALEDPVDGEDNRQSKRRRKKAVAAATDAQNQDKVIEAADSAGGKVECIVLVSDKKIVCFAPSVATPLKRLPVPSSSSGTPESVTASTWSQDQSALIISTTLAVSLIDISSGTSILSANLPSSVTPATTISALPSTSDKLTILLSNLHLTPLTVSLPLQSASSRLIFQTSQPIAVSPIRLALSLQGGNRLITAEEDARVATVWKLTDHLDRPLEMIASIPLPTSSPVHYAALDESNQLVAMLSTTGEISIYSTDLTSAHNTASTTANEPTDSPTPLRKKKASKAKGLPSLKPLSTVSLVEGKEARQAGIVALTFAGTTAGQAHQDVDMDGNAAAEGELVVGRMGGGGRVLWEKVNFIDASGDVIKNVVVKKTVMELAAPAMSDDPIPVKRFNADSATAGRATTIAFADEEAARLSRTQLELPVEGELADLTLGERLAVMEGNLPAVQRDGAVSDEDDDEDADEDEAPAGKSERKTKETGAVPTQLPIQTTQSLTRLLSQALHSSDQPLLSLILTSTTNSTPTLVRNTIRKMPASLALPLLKACVDRLGKGKQYDRRGGGRGGAIAPQQGRGVVAWIKGVLVERGSVLMAIPSLPVHLASLSQLLQSRLTLNQPLLALSGRLDLALAQIQMRKALASAQPPNVGRRYVEGESEDDEDSDEEEDDDDVEIEHGNEAGEIEEVRMASGRQSRDTDDEASDAEVAKVPASASKKSRSKGKGKANGDVDVVMDAAGGFSEEDESGSGSEEDEDEDEDDEALYDDEEDSDGRNPFIDDEASESEGDEEDDEEMEE